MKNKHKTIKFLKNKKAVSPLIATILLIAFAIALGAVVMNWGSTYVKKQTEDIESKSNADIKCSTDSYLRVLSINGVPQICLRNSSTPERVEFLLENGPNTDLEGVLVTLVYNGTTGSDTNVTLVSQIIQKARTAKLNVTYNTASFGLLKQVRVAPVMKIQNVKDTVICSKSALVLEDIYSCS
ncbi:MAG: hypothetical protein Q8O89_08315 [Nanoarchaeota archaeon]|nr:hypothetical protein [Nanoarchaeota archaeon]